VKREGENERGVATRGRIEIEQKERLIGDKRSRTGDLSANMLRVARPIGPHSPQVKDTDKTPAFHLVDLPDSKVAGCTATALTHNLSMKSKKDCASICVVVALTFVLQSGVLNSMLCRLAES
jgi:hypothetical protein